MKKRTVSLFYGKIAEALTACQFVEQDLKLYLTDALDFAKKCIKGRMPFKMTGDDYENSSLERLIEVFAKLSENGPLVKELREFKDLRNELSHRAIVDCLDYDREWDKSAVKELRAKLVRIQKDARRLSDAIHEEANKFRGHLYFDPVEE